MKENKFKALHKTTLKTWDEADLYFHNGEWFEDFRALKDNRPLNMDQCVVMQYTGLKDNRGLEIFEGDEFALEVPYIIFETGETFREVEYISVTQREGKYVLYEEGMGYHNLSDILSGWKLPNEYKCNGLVAGNVYGRKYWSRHDHIVLR